MFSERARLKEETSSLLARPFAEDRPEASPNKHAQGGDLREPSSSDTDLDELGSPRHGADAAMALPSLRGPENEWFAEVSSSPDAVEISEEN